MSTLSCSFQVNQHRGERSNPCAALPSIRAGMEQPRSLQPPRWTFLISQSKQVTATQLSPLHFSRSYQNCLWMNPACLSCLWNLRGVAAIKPRLLLSPAGLLVCTECSLHQSCLLLSQATLSNKIQRQGHPFSPHPLQIFLVTSFETASSVFQPHLSLGCCAELTPQLEPSPTPSVSSPKPWGFHVGRGSSKGNRWNTPGARARPGTAFCQQNGSLGKTAKKPQEGMKGWKFTPAMREINLGTPARPKCSEVGRVGSTLGAVSLLPGRRGLPCPAVGSAWHDPASPLAGPWWPWSLALAVPRLSSFHLHLNKQRQSSAGQGGPRAPRPLSHTPAVTLKSTLSILWLMSKYLIIKT